MCPDFLDASLPVEAPMARAAQAGDDRLEQLAQGGGERLKEASSQFEALLLGFMIKQMWESVDRSDLFEAAPGRDIQEGMFTTMLAEYLADQGGIGIAKSLQGQLEEAARASEGAIPDEESASAPSAEGPPGGVEVTH
jgi:Rod binding domain-containing protein